MSLDESVGVVVPAVYEPGREETGYLEKAAYYSVGKKVPTTEIIRPTIFERIKSGFQDAKEFAVESITGRLAEVKQQRAEAVEDAAIRSRRRQLEAQQKSYEREDRRRSVARSGLVLKNAVRVQTTVTEMASRGIERSAKALKNEEGRLSKRRVGVLALGLTATVGGAWFAQKYGANPFKGNSMAEHTPNGLSSTTTNTIAISPKVPTTIPQGLVPKVNSTSVQEMLPKPRINTDLFDKVKDIQETPKPTTAAITNVSETIRELNKTKGFDLNVLPSVNAGKLGIKDPVAALEKTRDLFDKRYGVHFSFTPNYAMVNKRGDFMDPGQLKAFNKLYAELYSEGAI